MQCPVKGCGIVVKRGALQLHLENPLVMAQHLRLLTNQMIDRERPDTVDTELVIRIPDMAENVGRKEFSFWSATHTLRIDGLGRGGYNFQLAIALKPPANQKGGVLAMFLHIKAGDYDELLQWPFPIPFSFAILDQTRPAPLNIVRKIEVHN